MAKFMSLMLLLVVAISWSQANASPVKRSIAKRSTEEIFDEDAITEEFGKELFAEILLLGAKSDEEPALRKRFEDAMSMKFDSNDEYAKKLLEIFVEVTGRKFSLDESSFYDSSEESAVDSPLAGPRTMQV